MRHRYKQPMAMHIMMLSPDIFSTIVEFAITLCDGWPSGKQAPLNISRTCRSWRKLMLSNGRFWSQFKIVGGNVRLATLWLRRSKEAPLDFQVTIFYNWDRDHRVFQRLLFKKQAFWHKMDVPFYCTGELKYDFGTLSNLPN